MLLQLELSAREKIKNLHMFVSPNRLIVHNLPKSVTDRQLRSICFMAAGECDAKITEVVYGAKTSLYVCVMQNKKHGHCSVVFGEINLQ